MSYEDTHKFLLRLIASQSVMLLEDTKQLVEKKAGNAVNIQEMVEKINEKIKPLRQEIRFVQDEVTTEELIVFLSTGYDDTTKAQNVFTAIELEFFRVLIEQIMSVESREITEISALNLVNNIKVNNVHNLKKTDARRMLGIWCRMQYLQKEENNYVLGVRAIHEFESYLLENMPDVMEKCSICKKIVYRGYNCPSCQLAIHIRCLEACLRKSQRWPCCQKEYIHSQLQQLRGQSSRLTQRSRLDVTQQSDSTQILEPTQVIEEVSTAEVTRADTSNEMEIEDGPVEDINASRRGKKRKRIA